MAFTILEDDYDDYCDDSDGIYVKDDKADDSKSFCKLNFLDMDELWGTTDWASQVRKDHDFTIFGYLKAGVAFSPEGTWNQQPAVGYGNVLAKVHVRVFRAHLYFRLTFLHGNKPCFL